MTLPIRTLERQDGSAVWFLNTLAIIKANANQTGGAFGLMEQLAPVGSGSPYHVHRAEDESFYVMEGEAEFISADRRFVGGPGAYVFLPRDMPHGYRVLGASAARFLILTTPGGFEGFVIEMGEPARSLTLPEPTEPDMNKLTVVAAKYRIEILGSLPQ